MPREQADRRRPARGHPQRAGRAEVLHGVVHQRLGRPFDRRAHRLRPPGQVGVLADVGERVGIEPFESFEQLPRVEDVGRLVVRAGLLDPERARVRAELAGLARIGQRAPLDHGARRGAGRRQQRLDPARGGNAVVVDERDQRRLRQRPAVVAGGRRSAGHFAAHVAQREGRRLHLALALAPHQLGSAPHRAVVHDDHLEVADRLLAQRVEQLAQPADAVARGHDDGDARGAHRVAWCTTQRTENPRVEGSLKRPRRSTWSKPADQIRRFQVREPGSQKTTSASRSAL